MIKNRKNLLLISIISMFVLTMNVNAANISVEAKPGHPTAYGYNTQTQKVSHSCTNGSINIYCIDKGLSNQNSFDDCTISLASSVYQQVAGMGLGHDDAEYMYRVIANRLGQVKVDYASKYPSIKNYQQYLTPDKADLVKNATKTTQSSITSGFSHKKLNDSTAQVTATLGVATLNQGNFKVSGGTITNFVNQGNGTYVLNISVANASCSGKKVSIEVTGASASSLNQGSGAYYASCPRQNYIIEVTGGCSINDVLDKGTGASYTFTFTGDCCKGVTNLDGECSDGTVSDNVDEIKSCIETDGFQEYCQDSVRKKGSDTGKSKTSEHDGSTVATTFASNNYCKVYCLEEVSYDMPGKLKTKNGAYFKLSKGYDFGLNKQDESHPISITGKRTCYTSQIKIADYKSKMESLQKELAQAIKDYNYDMAVYKDFDNAKGNMTHRSGSDPAKGIAACQKYKNQSSAYNSCVAANSSCSYEVYKAASPTEYEFYTPSFANGEISGISTGKDSVSIEYTKPGNCPGYADTLIQPVKPDTSAIENILTLMDKEIKNYKMCYEYNNNYCFNPQIEFGYDEPYKEVEGTLEQSSNTVVGNEEKYYTNVDEKYNGDGGASQTHTAKYGFYEMSGDFVKYKTQESPQVNTVQSYVSKTQTVQTKFKTATKDVYTLHPTGTICTGNNCKDKNYVHLGYVLPVALQHQNATGLYNYYLEITNIGTTGDDVCKTDGQRKGFTGASRLMGESCSIFNTEGSVTPEDPEYTCQYETEECPGCEIECVCPPNRPDCTVEDKVCKYKTDCPTCKIKCIGCIWNNGDTTVAYKQISLTNMFPNQDTDKNGYNWNTSDSIDTNDKASSTIKKIESDAEKAYDSEPMYSYVLTPSTMSEIRKYNEKANQDCPGNSKTNCVTGSWGKYEIWNGGYSNDTLSCSNGEKCESSFLNGLQDYSKNEGSKCWYTFDSTNKTWKCSKK